MKSIKVYRPKRLINGKAIHQKDDKKYVAIPDRGYKDSVIKVKFNKKVMTIKNWHKAIMFRCFHDQFRRGSTYTLGYFEFVADKKIEYELHEDGVYRQVKV